MKKVSLFIQPRQTGKTTKLALQFLNNIDNTNYKNPIIIVKNEDTRNCMIRSHMFDNTQRMRIFTVENIRNKRYIGSFVLKNVLPINDVLIDEYLFFSKEEKEVVYNFLQGEDIGEVVSFTTSDRFYNKEEIEGVKLWKQMSRGFIQKYILHINTNNDEFHELYMNLITEPCCTVYEWNFEERRKYMTENQYKIEVIGQVYETV